MGNLTYTVWLLGQRSHTCVKVCPLLIPPYTALYNANTEVTDGSVSDPVAEFGNPDVIFEDGTIVVEAPKGDLRRKLAVRIGGFGEKSIDEVKRLTCFNVVGLVPFVSNCTILTATSGHILLNQTISTPNITTHSKLGVGTGANAKKYSIESSKPVMEPSTGSIRPEAFGLKRPGGTPAEPL